MALVQRLVGPFWKLRVYSLNIGARSNSAELSLQLKPLADMLEIYEKKRIQSQQ